MEIAIRRSLLFAMMLASIGLAAMATPKSAHASLHCPHQNTPPGVGWLCGPVYHMYNALAQSTDSLGYHTGSSVCVRAYYAGYGFIGGTACDSIQGGTTVIGLDNPPYVNGYAYPINNHPYNHYIYGVAGWMQ